jgi:hypothetical protein
MANNKEDNKWIITVLVLLILLGIMIGVPVYYAPKLDVNIVKDSTLVDTLAVPMRRPDWNKFEN